MRALSILISLSILGIVVFTQFKPAEVKPNLDLVASKPSSSIPTSSSQATPAKLPPSDSEGVPSKELEKVRPLFQQKTAIAQSSSAELHQLPKATRVAAKALGEVRERELKHPEQRAEFLNFYRECADDKQTITVLRVLCLKDYTRLAGLSQAAELQLLEGFEPVIRRLYLAPSR